MLFLLLLPLAVPAGDMPDTALCSVCAVTEGAREPEKVVASVLHEGRTHYFCSKPCLEAFRADPAAFAPPDLPRPAPEVTLADREGQAVLLGSEDGRVLLIDFWATWCKPCLAAMPELDKLHAELGPRGFAVVGVSIDEEVSKVEKLLRKRPVSYPILLDTAPEPAWAAYGVRIIPAAFLVDRTGSIVAQWTGAPDLPSMRAAVQAELAK